MTITDRRGFTITVTGESVDPGSDASAAAAMKLPCVAATTANISLLGEQTVDGVSVVVGNRVLVKNQDASSQNGIYVCATGSWARSSDADGASELVSGTLVYVISGTENGKTDFAIIFTGALSLDTTALTIAAADGRTFAPSATTDTTNASNISSGTLPNARLSTASSAEVIAGSDAAKPVTSSALSGAGALLTLVDAAPITWDMESGYNAVVTPSTNRTISAPTHFVVGQSYTLQVIQGSGGSKLITWNACYNWGAAGTPVLSTTAGAIDLVTMICVSNAPKFACVIARGF